MDDSETFYVSASTLYPAIVPLITTTASSLDIRFGEDASQQTPPTSSAGQSAASERVLYIQSDVILWSVVNGLLVIIILSGNTLTILALRFSRRLRSVISNMFVLSLAVSDMVVGFTLPFHLAFYMTPVLGNIQIWCLLRFFLIIMACCVSIWNLTAIAIDRYIAIMYPLHYTRYMNRRVAIILLGFGWTLSFILAAVPMFWNNWSTAEECEFDEILPPWYMAGVITPLFSVVWTCLLFAYFRIWREASRQVKQLRSTPFSDRVSDWKSVQVVLLILGCFSICWLPYFIVACIQIFSLFDHSSPILYKCAFSLAMANSGMNPLIYAWKNKNFRRAFALLLRCKNPDIAYRDDCHIPNRNNNNSNNNNVTLPKKRNNIVNKPVTVTNGSENASTARDRDIQCYHPRLNSTTSNCNTDNNSHSAVALGMDEEVYVSTIATGRFADNILAEIAAEMNNDKFRGASLANESTGSSSSTGTDNTDDTFET